MAVYIALMSYRAKYPLATVDNLIDNLGQDLGVGYDIGCAFKATVRGSGLLADKAAQHNILFVVNSFHGYAHNCMCQLHNHPLYIPGCGLEDFETMERVFSSSNGVAPTIRHASQFHFIQSLDLHFQQWDDDKYCELSE